MKSTFQCTLEDNIAAYDAIKTGLERRAWGEWVVINNKKIVPNGRKLSYESFQSALEAATPFLVSQNPLIRHVGAVAYLRSNGFPNLYMPPNPYSLPKPQAQRQPTMPTN